MKDARMRDRIRLVQFGFSLPKDTPDRSLQRGRYVVAALVRTRVPTKEDTDEALVKWLAQTDAALLIMLAVLGMGLSAVWVWGFVQLDTTGKLFALAWLTGVVAWRVARHGSKK